MKALEDRVAAGELDPGKHFAAIERSLVRAERKLSRPGID